MQNTFIRLISWSKTGGDQTGETSQTKRLIGQLTKRIIEWFSDSSSAEQLNELLNELVDELLNKLLNELLNKLLDELLTESANWWRLKQKWQTEVANHAPLITRSAEPYERLCWANIRNQAAKHGSESVLRPPLVD